MNEETKREQGGRGGGKVGVGEREKKEPSEKK